MAEKITAHSVSFIFHGKNFQVSKFQSQSILVPNGLKDIVNDTEEKPDGQYDARAFFNLSTSMSSDQLEQLLACTTADEMRTKLQVICEQNLDLNRELLLQKYFSCRMELGYSVEQYVTKLQNMAQLLEDVGEKVSTASLMARVVDGLPSKFDVFCAAWDYGNPDHQTVDKFLECLLKEERRLSRKDEEKIMFIASSPDNNKRRCRQTNAKPMETSRNKTFLCYRCKKPGHLACNCRSEKQFQGQSGKQLT